MERGEGVNIEKSESRTQTKAYPSDYMLSPPLKILYWATPTTHSSYMERDFMMNFMRNSAALKVLRMVACFMVLVPSTNITCSNTCFIFATSNLHQQQHTNTRRRNHGERTDTIVHSEVPH